MALDSPKELDKAKTSKKDTLELKVHELLLFHFLSILALIPARRVEFDEIIDKFNNIFSKESLEKSQRLNKGHFEL